MLEKGGKESPITANIYRQKAVGLRNNMSGTGKKNELPGKNESRPKKRPPPAPIEDDDIEDGDIATPKRDRYGEDDQPL
jgi:hypothetical protein